MSTEKKTIMVTGTNQHGDAVSETIAAPRRSMTFADLMAASQISHRFDFSRPLTYQVVQRLLEEIYLCSRANPQYIFVAEQDHLLLKQHIIECTNIRCPPEMIQDALGRIGYHCLNETTGKLMYLVPLPGLEQGSVIVGFFR